MFTGLVEDLGRIVTTLPLPRSTAEHGGKRVRIASALLDEILPLGASIAVDGACLTVVAAHPGEIEVEVGPETLSRTTLGALRPGQRVHLERALRLSDRLGGHLVAGHVDGLGTIEASAARGDSWDLTVRAAPGLLRYVIEKGSIAIDGVSLTVNTVDERAFSVSLVPHTQQRTHLAARAVGETVNLEVDLIGKYVEKLLGGYGAGSAQRPGLTLDKLKEHGFVHPDKSPGPSDE